jgi:hypothetical protein
MDVLIERLLYEKRENTFTSLIDFFDMGSTISTE